MKSKIMPLKNVHPGRADVLRSCGTGWKPTRLPPEGMGICWQMKRLEELQAGIFLIRDTADEWETNYFISGEQAGAWIDHNEVTGDCFQTAFLSYARGTIFYTYTSSL